MPPSPITFHILLALASHDQTANELMSQVAEDTQSTLLIREVSLYWALVRLQREGLVTKLQPSRRYSLTSHGRQVLQREKVRLGRATSLLHART